MRQESESSPFARTVHPLLYQINTRVWLRTASRKLGRAATLDDVPDDELERLARIGFDWVWFLGVWQTGEAGRRIALQHPDLRREFWNLLPDLKEEDISGSCFAIQDYKAHPDLGGDGALARLRERLNKQGLRLLLDYVPNHVVLDHPWVEEYPEFFIQGTEENLSREPQNYCRVQTPQGSRILAYGRDSYFPGWTDTLQLNYGNSLLQEAMIGELAKISELGDGVACESATLLLPEVFLETWGISMESFWPKAIRKIREQDSGFLFLAEGNGDFGWILQQQGFDYTYDKKLYNLLRAQRARPIREYLRADTTFQSRSAHFLENHDQPRAAETFPPRVHRAAAILTFLIPGLRFFHQGQFAGWKKKLPVQLCRWPAEPIDEEMLGFYYLLVDRLRERLVGEGQWQLLECVPAWEGNWTWDCFVAFTWEGTDGRRLLVVVNYAPHQSQCYVRLSFRDLGGGVFQLKDKMGSATYDRNGESLTTRGLYLDMPEWGTHVFEMSRIG